MRALGEPMDALADRLAKAQPDLQPPAVLLRRLAEALGGEQVLLLCGDLRALGFGAYEGQLCVVTTTRVLLVTGLREHTAEAEFAIEQWERESGPMPPVLSIRARLVGPAAG